MCRHPFVTMEHLCGYPPAFIRACVALFKRVLLALRLAPIRVSHDLNILTLETRTEWSCYDSSYIGWLKGQMRERRSHV